MLPTIILSKGSLELHGEAAEELSQLLEMADDHCADFSLTWEEAQPIFAPPAWQLARAHAGAA